MRYESRKPTCPPTEGIPGIHGICVRFDWTRNQIELPSGQGIAFLSRVLAIAEFVEGGAPRTRPAMQAQAWFLQFAGHVFRPAAALLTKQYPPVQPQFVCVEFWMLAQSPQLSPPVMKLCARLLEPSLRFGCLADGVDRALALQGRIDDARGAAILAGSNQKTSSCLRPFHFYYTRLNRRL